MDSSRDVPKKRAIFDFTYLNHPFTAPMAQLHNLPITPAASISRRGTVASPSGQAGKIPVDTQFLWDIKVVYRRICSLRTSRGDLYSIFR